MTPRTHTPARRLTLLALLITLPLAALLGLAGDGRPPVAQAAAPEPREFTIGSSAQGRPIQAVQFGDGPRKLVVVGNTHGGPEANTYRLTLALIAHFRANPGLVPPSVRLYFIPTLNPDGLARGWRFDAAGVDLNRNMNTGLDACPENDWNVTVQGAYGQISDTGGPFPDSQVESRLIRGFLLDAAGAIFIHSNAGLVFPALCEHGPSIAMAEAYAGAAGYLYSRFWPNYTITGGMHDWAGSLGIAAITPELLTGDQTEFEPNLAGLLAVLSRAEEVLPLPEPGLVAGITVPPPIFRYWRALGGEARFGSPLGPALASPGGVSQRFRNAVIAARDDRADTPTFVQAEPVGATAAASQAFGGAAALAPVAAGDGAQFFPETGHTLRAGFLEFWRRGGGLEVFGLPLSEEFAGRSADGGTRTLQYFERAVLSYDDAAGEAHMEPLGLREQALEDLRAPLAPQTVR